MLIYPLQHVPQLTPTITLPPTLSFSIEFADDKDLRARLDIQKRENEEIIPGERTFVYIFNVWCVKLALFSTLLFCWWRNTYNLSPNLSWSDLYDTDDYLRDDTLEEHEEAGGGPENPDIKVSNPLRTYVI